MTNPCGTGGGYPRLYGYRFLYRRGGRILPLPLHPSLASLVQQRGGGDIALSWYGGGRNHLGSGNHHSMWHPPLGRHTPSWTWLCHRHGVAPRSDARVPIPGHGLRPHCPLWHAVRGWHPTGHCSVLGIPPLRWGVPSRGPAHIGEVGNQL